MLGLPLTLKQLCIVFLSSEFNTSEFLLWTKKTAIQIWNLTRGMVCFKQQTPLGSEIFQEDVPHFFEESSRSLWRN